jgi:hypothetical protein
MRGFRGNRDLTFVIRASINTASVLQVAIGTPLIEVILTIALYDLLDFVQSCLDRCLVMILTRRNMLLDGRHKHLTHNTIIVAELRVVLNQIILPDEFNQVL